MSDYIGNRSAARNDSAQGNWRNSNAVLASMALCKLRWADE